MPKAVADLTTTERFDLKSLEGGYVKLRRMSYGQIVQRRAMSKMSVDMGGKSKDVKGELAMASEAITAFEFKHCVVEHNLDKDDDGNLLNFASPEDFRSLDPKVGQEIEKYITDMNSFDEDDQEN